MSPRTNGPRCGAQTDHGPCGQPAGAGTAHKGTGSCKHHLGNAPSHVKSARRAQAEEACRKFAVPVDVSAEDALIGALAVAHGVVLFYRARVQELSHDHMTAGTERITRVRTTNGGGAQVVEDRTVAKSMPNVWITLLNEADRHYAAVAETVARLGIEQRKLDLGHEQAAMVRAVILLALHRLAGISPDDPRIRVELPPIIRELTGGDE